IARAEHGGLARWKGFAVERPTAGAKFLGEQCEQFVLLRCLRYALPRDRPPSKQRRYRDGARDAMLRQQSGSASSLNRQIPQPTRFQQDAPPQKSRIPCRWESGCQCEGRVDELVFFQPAIFPDKL